MYSSTMENLSSAALEKAAHALPDLKAFSNGQTFNDQFKGNRSFVYVRYQDKTGSSRLVVPETKFTMEVDKLESFRAAIDVYHAVLRKAQEEVVANYQDHITLQEGEYFDERNYYYFQRVGTDFGFSHVYASESNAFLGFLRQVTETYLNECNEYGEAIEREETIHLYHLLKEDGQYVLGDHAGERVDCKCWMSFGECRHALLHVTTEATYDTLETAVTALVAKSKGLKEKERLLIVTEENYAVLLEAGQVVSRYAANEGIDRVEEVWAAHIQKDSDRCECTEDRPCDFCLGAEEYEEYEEEGPYGGAFRDQEDYENYRFGGLSYLNSI